MRKMIYLLFAAAVLTGVHAAHARDATTYVDLRKALDSEEFRKALGNEVAFFLAGENVPAIQQQSPPFSTRISTSQGTTYEASCNRVLLKIFSLLRDRAKKEGANAVVDIGDGDRPADPGASSQVECHNGGTIRARVRLRARVARIAR